MSMADEMREHLQNHIVPFWQKLEDKEYGGFYGYMGPDLAVDKKAVKGCILNSRILWFFSNASMALADKELLKDAECAYDFMTKYCFYK